MIEETVTAAAVCITAAIFSTLLKQYCREHALFCVIGAVLLAALTLEKGA